MVIDDIDIERVSVLPFEADAPLSINADAVLALAITFQPFKLIRRRNHKIAQVDGTIQILQPLARLLLDPASVLTNSPLKIACVSLFLQDRFTRPT